MSASGFIAPWPGRFATTWHHDPLCGEWGRAMAEKRGLDRHRKRFHVRFGDNGPCYKAFTEDISTTGIFIKKYAFSGRQPSRFAQFQLQR